MTRKEFLDAYNLGYRDGKIEDYCPNDYDDIFDIEQEPKTERIEYGTDGNSYKLTISNGKEFERDSCDTCEHLDEIDGSNCYECVKDMRNNYNLKKQEPLTKDELYDVVIMIMRHIRPDGEFSSFSFSEVNYIDDLLNKIKAEQAKLINKIKSKSEDK